MEEKHIIAAMPDSASSGVALSQNAVLDSVALNASDAFSYVLLAGRNKPDWVHEVCAQLASFRNLAPNWDSYGGLQPSAASIAAAKVLLHTIGQIVGVERPHVGISPGGNVALSWEFAQGNRNLDAEVLGTGEVRFAYLNEENASADREGATSNPLEVANLLTQW